MRITNCDSYNSIHSHCWWQSDEYIEMISQFVEQVQILMEIQQIKQSEIDQWNEKSKYNWLCTKKVSLVILSLKQECKIRQALTKITVEDQIEILRKLMKWLTVNPFVEVEKIPGITLDLINNTIRTNLINQTNFSRINSFRNSLRRLSNRISPAEKPRSVTFKDTPIVYKISK